ncbi:MAG: hypothetical protein QNJ42_07310 [Crocosphaera sp.]|nr:hypothetical protein [Crocosphaera sp.]
MAGFFGLFSGRKAKFVDEADTTPAQPQKKEAFFLDNDSAKTLGDTEFMRKPITIKRTFAKGGELVQEISSLEKKKSGSNAIPSNKGKETKTTQGTASVNSDRRKADNSMDMFRNMARNMKK